MSLLSGQSRCVTAFKTGRHHFQESYKPITFPEVSDGEHGVEHIRNKPSFGVSIGGGGFRAATLASGWIRGLHKVTVTSSDGESSALSKVKYLSTISGGSWFNAPFSFDQKIGLEKFLGRCYEPGQLVGAAKKPELAIEKEVATDRWPWLRKILPGMQASATDAQLDIDLLPAEGSFDLCLATTNAVDFFLYTTLMENAENLFPRLASWNGLQKLKELESLAARAFLRNEGSKARPWTRAIKEAFLEPYGLADMDTTVSAAGTAAAAALIKDLGPGKVLLACTDKDRPYPIMSGTVFREPGDDGFAFYPIEFTPLYVGTPGAFDECDPPLGAGYVEPLGLHSHPGPLPDALTGKMNVKIEHAVPLAQMVGISSSFFAAGAHATPEIMQNLASTEHLYYWGLCNGNSTAGSSKANDTAAPKCAEMHFADGGAADNTGITSLLRRKVKHIVACVATDNPPDQDWEAYAKDACDIASLFGAAKSSFIPKVEYALLNDCNHVFGGNGQEGELLFRDLYDHLHEQLRSGKAPFYRASYTVQKNAYHAIEGGWEVDVLWVTNQQVKDWEADLTDNVRDRLRTERSSNGHELVNCHTVLKRPRLGAVEQIWQGGWGYKQSLSRFPYFTTFSLHYGNAEVNMLSQLASWVMKQAGPQVQKMLKDAERD